MKTSFISLITLSIAALSITACDSASKLANDIQGSWSGAPEKLIDNGPAISSYLPVITFIKNDATKGNVTVAATVSISQQSNDTSLLSISGRTTISGKWTATDDDELYINFDPSTLDISIDPDAVVMTKDMSAGTEQASTHLIDSTLLPTIKTRITSAVQNRMLGISKVEDIKVNNGILTCEINDLDRIFHAIE